jgi:hypothetical protein
MCVQSVTIAHFTKFIYPQINALLVVHVPVVVPVPVVVDDVVDVVVVVDGVQLA